MYVGAAEDTPIVKPKTGWLRHVMDIFKYGGTQAVARERRAAVMPEGVPIPLYQPTVIREKPVMQARPERSIEDRLQAISDDAERGMKLLDRKLSVVDHDADLAVSVLNERLSVLEQQIAL